MNLLTNFISYASATGKADRISEANVKQMKQTERDPRYLPKVGIIP